jgi:uncharacterized protein (TIGR03086 family)
MTPDLAPASSIVAELIRGTHDEQLAAPTPCGGITVGELLDHLDSLCVAFTAAATKTPRADGRRAPIPDGSRLGNDWRQRLLTRLDELTHAWQPASAWTGTAQAGGNTLPAQVAGAAALNEVIVHGWDPAIATCQPYPNDDRELADPLQTAYEWVRRVVAQHPHGSAGLFGPTGTRTRQCGAARPADRAHRPRPVVATDPADEPSSAVRRRASVARRKTGAMSATASSVPEATAMTSS